MYRPEVLGFAYEQSELPGAVEAAFLNLQRFPNVQVDTLELSSAKYSDLKTKIRNVRKEMRIGARRPTTAVFCAHGIYRSKIIADHLFKDKLITKSAFNFNVDSARFETTGAGLAPYNGDSLYRFEVDNNGGIIDARFKTPIDLVILALSAHPNRQKDRRCVSQVTKYLEDTLPGTTQETQNRIIWLQGTEDEVHAWLPKSSPVTNPGVQI